MNRQNTHKHIFILSLLRWGKINKNGIKQLLPALTSRPAKSLGDLIEVVADQNIDSSIEKEKLQEAWEYAKRSLERADELGLSVVAIDEDKFPQKLQDIPNPPLLLFVRGNPDCLHAKNSVAVIGTREPTWFGKGSAFRIAKYFAEKDVTVVSGLAKGCDTHAHMGCLEGKGRTAAVLAHGLDHIYPAENANLAQEILYSDGCLVSEYPPFAKAKGMYFVERDRIQSGLSDVTIVIETGIKGGTLHTANFCLQQGRMLAAIKHPDDLKHEEKVQGNRMLINKMGAVAISNREDLEEKINRFLQQCSVGEKSLSDWKSCEQLNVPFLCNSQS